MHIQLHPHIRFFFLKQSEQICAIKNKKKTVKYCSANFLWLFGKTIERLSERYFYFETPAELRVLTM